MLRQTAVLALALIALAGCADGVKLTYSCNPVGAVVLPDVGICPVEARYPVTPRDRSRGYIDIPAGNVIWASGATIQYPSQRLFFRNGDQQIIHFDRPASFPGYETDVQVAIERMRYREANRMQRQLETERSLDTFTDTMRALQPVPPARTNCVSSIIENNIFTNCR